MIDLNKDLVFIQLADKKTEIAFPVAFINGKTRQKVSGVDFSAGRFNFPKYNFIV